MPLAPISPVDAVCNAAEMLTPVRETLGANGRPDNNGRFVNAIQVFAGGAPGEYWCCDFVYWVMQHILRAANPMPKSGSCQTVMLHAVKRGVLRRTNPQRGDQFFLLRDDGTAHHTGIVTGVRADGTWTTVEGNARDQASSSSDGDGVHDCVRGNDGLSYAFARWALAPLSA